MPSTHSRSTAEFGRMSVKQVAAVALLSLACATLRSQTVDPRPLPRPEPKNPAYPVAVRRPTPPEASSQRTGKSPTQLSTPTERRGSDRDPSDSSRKTGGDGGEIARDITIAALAGVTLTLIIKAAENRSHEGPKIKSRLDMSDFTIEGLAGANWPVGFDFTAGSPGSVSIEITSDGGHKAFRKMRVAVGRRDSFRFYLPPDYSAKVQDAKYHVLFTPDADSTSAAPGLRAFGLGAGDCAVALDSLGAAAHPCPTLTSALIPVELQGAGGPSFIQASWTNAQPGQKVPDYGSSVQLDQVRFGPGIVQPKLKEMANYSFRARHAFNDVRPDFMLTTAPNGHILLLKDREDQAFPMGEGEIAQKTWDPANSKQGDHMLQLKAWRGLEAGGDWAIVWSQDVVTIEK